MKLEESRGLRPPARSPGRHYPILAQSLGRGRTKEGFENGFAFQDESESERGLSRDESFDFAATRIIRRLITARRS